MNLSRSIAGFLSSSNPEKWDLIKSASALHFRPFSTERAVRAYQKSSKPETKAKVDVPVEPTTVKNLSELPRPSLIPFQPKVANSVHLVGTIDTGVKLQQLSDGIYASASILVNENMEMRKDTSRFWIPIIFRGDLAEIAACHLKKNDLIYVSGQLTGDNLAFTHEDAKENIKLLAHSLNFVKDDSSPKKGGNMHKQDEVSTSDSGNLMTILTDIIPSMTEKKAEVLPGLGARRSQTTDRHREAEPMSVVRDVDDGEALDEAC